MYINVLLRLLKVGTLTCAVVLTTLNNCQAMESSSDELEENKINNSSKQYTNSANITDVQSELQKFKQSIDNCKNVVKELSKDGKCTDSNDLYTMGNYQDRLQNTLINERNEINKQNDQLKNMAYQLARSHDRNQKNIEDDDVPLQEIIKEINKSKELTSKYINQLDTFDNAVTKLALTEKEYKELLQESNAINLQHLQLQLGKSAESKTIGNKTINDEDDGENDIL